MKKVSFLLIGLLLSFFITGISGAAVILSDDFNTEQYGLNYELHYDLDNWTVTEGTIDVIGTGPTGVGWEYFGGANGYYVDLDGSTMDAGRLTSDLVFGHGTYTISYDLAGSRRGDVNTLDIYFGDFLETVTMASNDGWTTYTRTITLDNAASLIFDHKGGDNMGLFLDNVSVEFLHAPEPGTMMLLGAGLIFIAGVSRKKARRIISR